MLDLDPDRELERYRHYKSGNLEPAVESAAHPVREEDAVANMNLSIDTTADEEDEEDYEVIPPSQSFANQQEISSQVSSHSVDYFPAGEMIHTGQLREDASLELDFMPPGEMTSAHDRYLPASQELWQSLGQPAPVDKPLPKWQLPVAVGAMLIAGASVVGMSYVNMHPSLLQGVPVLANLTSPIVVPAIPPGQTLSGPDLAMGEFSELTLSNINSISIAPAEPLVAAAPVPTAPAAALAPAPLAANPVSPGLLPGTAPQTVAPALTLPPTGAPARLSDGLMRNLLPPNIQQLAGQQQSSATGAQPAQPSIQPYAATPNTANQLYYQPPAAASSRPMYTVMANYVNPLGFAKIQSLIPGATMKGNQIDLGSFSRQSAAMATVKKLKQEGVRAWIAKQPS
jgi:hypothetical protein